MLQLTLNKDFGQKPNVGNMAIGRLLEPKVDGMIWKIANEYKKRRM